MGQRGIPCFAERAQAQRHAPGRPLALRGPLETGSGAVSGRAPELALTLPESEVMNLENPVKGRAGIYGDSHYPQGHKAAPTYDHYL